MSTESLVLRTPVLEKAKKSSFVARSAPRDSALRTKTGPRGVFPGRSLDRKVTLSLINSQDSISPHNNLAGINLFARTYLDDIESGLE